LSPHRTIIRMSSKVLIHVDKGQDMAVSFHVDASNSQPYPYIKYKYRIYLLNLTFRDQVSCYWVCRLRILVTIFILFFCLEKK
jgi:hypothetical protein